MDNIEAIRKMVRDYACFYPFHDGGTNEPCTTAQLKQAMDDTAKIFNAILGRLEAMANE